MDEEIRRENLSYRQSKQRNETSKAWQENKKERYEQQKKGFKPSPFWKVAGNFWGNKFNKSNNHKTCQHKVDQKAQYL